MFFLSSWNRFEHTEQSLCLIGKRLCFKRELFKYVKYKIVVWKVFIIFGNKVSKIWKTRPTNTKNSTNKSTYQTMTSRVQKHFPLQLSAPKPGSTFPSQPVDLHPNDGRKHRIFVETANSFWSIKCLLWVRIKRRPLLTYQHCWSARVRERQQGPGGDGKFPAA